MPRRKQKPTKSPKTPTRRWHQRIVRRLKVLAEEMRKVGTDMDYYGGFGEIGDHGRAMVGASRMALTWANGIERGELDKPWLANVLKDAKRSYNQLPKWAKPSNND